MMKATLFAVLVCLLMVGCAEKEVGTNTDSGLEGVNNNQLVRLSGIAYRKGSFIPYTGKSFQLYAKGKKKAKANWKDGKYEGLVEVWHENGQKKFEGNFKNGKLEGFIQVWHENGQKKEDGNWKDGKYNGLVFQWHANGQKSLEAKYKYGGKKDGSRMEWHENGQRKLEGNWKDGKEDGLQTMWYRSGQKASESSIKDGKFKSAKAWKPNGEKCPYTNLLDGNGLIVWYNDDGTELESATYKDGERVSNENKPNVVKLIPQDVFGGKFHEVKRKLENGADPDAILLPKGKRTALHCCCMGGRVNIVKLLLAGGASPNALDKYNMTPLDILFSPDEKGRAPLERMSAENQLEIQRMLEKAGGKRNRFPKAQAHKKKVTENEGKTLAQFLPGKKIYYWSPPPGESLQKNKRPNSVLRFSKEGPWDMGMVFSDKEVFPLSELPEVFAKQFYTVDGLQVDLSGEMVAGAKAWIVFSSHKPRKGDQMELGTEGQEARTLTISWISETGSPLPDDVQFDSQEESSASVMDDALPERPKPKKIKASLWDATLLGWKSVVQQHVDAGTDLNEVLSLSSPPQTALDMAIKENQSEIAHLLRKNGAMTFEELKAERDEWMQKLKEVHGSLMRLDALQLKWPGLDSIKQAQGFQEWFRNKTGVTDVSVFFPNRTKKFGYDLAVPSKDLASLPKSPSGPFPLMWTTGLEEGDLDTHWSKGSPWGKEGGHVLFSDGRVKWYSQTFDEENFDGILIKYGKPGEDTSDFGQAVPEGWQILKSN
tara:strand:- start:758 stop:3061 length:2304 start_codon:yes stop_codon:yes gene_type:complete